MTINRGHFLKSGHAGPAVHQRNPEGHGPSSGKNHIPSSSIPWKRDSEPRNQNDDATKYKGLNWVAFFVYLIATKIFFRKKRDSYRFLNGHLVHYIHQFERVQWEFGIPSHRGPTAFLFQQKNNFFCNLFANLVMWQNWRPSLALCTGIEPVGQPMRCIELTCQSEFSKKTAKLFCRIQLKTIAKIEFRQNFFWLAKYLAPAVRTAIYSFPDPIIYPASLELELLNSIAVTRLRWMIAQEDEKSGWKWIL